MKNCGSIVPGLIIIGIPVIYFLAMPVLFVVDNGSIQEQQLEQVVQEEQIPDYHPVGAENLKDMIYCEDTKQITLRENAKSKVLYKEIFSFNFGEDYVSYKYYCAKEVGYDIEKYFIGFKCLNNCDKGLDHQYYREMVEVDKNGKEITLKSR